MLQTDYQQTNDSNLFVLLLEVLESLFSDFKMIWHSAVGYMHQTKS